MPQGKLVFEYFPTPTRDSETGKVFQIYRPFIPIQVSADNEKTYAFRALVDSGSDRNLLPAAFGVTIGLNIKNGIKRKIGGIGNSQILAYTWEIKLTVLGLSPATFITFADFSYEQQIPLLGRDGFFNLFRSIEFRERRKLLELGF